MEVLETKLQHLTAAPMVEPFFPVGPIENIARKLLMKGTFTAHKITSVMMSKWNSNRKKDLTYLSENFCSDPEPESVIYLLANNPKTSSTLLDQISINSTIAISEAIAMNENTSRATLRRLANHSNPKVRAAVTENSYAPLEVLSLLCEDEHPDVRFTMAENPDVPRSLLEKLTSDNNPFIASRASTTLRRLDAPYSVICLHG